MKGNEIFVCVVLVWDFCLFIYFWFVWQEEGKIFIRLHKGKDEERWELSVGCDLPGKWIIHWGVTFSGDTGW